MTFHSIVRQWCKTYKPMLDSPTNGNKRFYLTDSTGGVVDLAKGIEPKFSPCVVMESSIEGGGSITRPNLNYPIYFFCRARDTADGDCAAEAKMEAWYHAQQFLSWLMTMREKELDNNIDGDFARIDLDDALLDIQTVGPLQDGWYAVLIQFERAEPLNLCPDPDMYIVDPNAYDTFGEYADAYLQALEKAAAQEESDGDGD